MKIMQVILLLFLVCKGTMGISMTCNMGSADCCGSEKTEVLDTETSDTDKEDSNCCGSNCSCLCCSYVFNLEAQNVEFPISRNTKDTFISPFQQSLSHRDFSNDVWQPPRAGSK